MKAIKKSGIAFCMLFMLAQATLACAQEAQNYPLDKNGLFFISAGLETMDGDTTYRIGYPVTLANGITYAGYFPISELTWPLDIELARIEGGFRVAENFFIQAVFKKNISDPNDNMEDRDWLSSYRPSRLDVYSESSISDLSAVIVDAELQWYFYRNSIFAAYAGGGYMYQNFDYDSSLIRQFSPSGLYGYDYIGDGRLSITYDIDYHIPYLSFGMDAAIADSLIFSGKLGYSPYAVAEDEDHHLLRENGGKISEGDMDGYAVFLEASARYLFLENFFAELGGSITRIDVEGEQEQRYVLGGQIAEVSMESVSDQYSVYFNVGFTF